MTLLDEDRERWYSDEWKKRRSKMESLLSWYEGSPLDVTEQQADSEGHHIRRFPLRLNINALACDTHRDMVRGQVDNDPLFVKARVTTSDSVTSAKAKLIEDLLNEQVWHKSQGGAMLQEAILSANVYGGTIFKLAFEFWNRDLPYGLAVRNIRNPGYVDIVWDHLNRWRIMEVWYGYELDPETAKQRYGIDTPKDSNGVSQQALYMEHWTERDWRIRVNGQVPKMAYDDGTEAELQGENGWGFVPFYFVPHERFEKAWGRGQIEGKEELSKELNARLANVGDLFRSIRGNLYWAHDTSRQLTTQRVRVAGGDVEFIMAGNAAPMAGSKSPGIDSMPTPDIPQGYAEYASGTIVAQWMQHDRLSPAIFGMDDSASGRLTGPAVAQRMWTTSSHADTERLNMTTVKTILDTDIVRLFGLPAFKEDLQKLNRRTPPEIEPDDGYIVKIIQQWPQSLPLDVEVEHRMRMDKIRENAMSIKRFLEEDGVLDVDTELDEIIDWSTRKKEAGIDQPSGLFGGGNESGNSSPNNGV